MPDKYSETQIKELMTKLVRSGKIIRSAHNFVIVGNVIWELTTHFVIAGKVIWEWANRTFHDYCARVVVHT